MGAVVALATAVAQPIPVAQLAAPRTITLSWVALPPAAEAAAPSVARGEEARPVPPVEAAPERDEPAREIAEPVPEREEPLRAVAEMSPPVAPAPSTPPEPALHTAERSVASEPQQSAPPPKPPRRPAPSRPRTEPPREAPAARAVAAHDAPSDRPASPASKAPKVDPAPEPPQAAPSLLAAASPLPAAPVPSPLTTAPSPDQPLSVFCSHRPPPDYPPVARRLGEEGTVVVLVTVNGDGTIAAAEQDKAQTTARHPLLVRAALEVVKSWRCSLPPEWRTRQVVVRQPFRFQLQ
ncbi:energy transducer TonB [Hydrogenophilus islandicus]